MQSVQDIQKKMFIVDNAGENTLYVRVYQKKAIFADFDVLLQKVAKTCTKVTQKI